MKIDKNAIVYREEKADKVHLFKTKQNKWGALKEGNAPLIDPNFDSIHYDDDRSLFTCVDFHKDSPDQGWSYHFFDLEGIEKAVFHGMESMRAAPFGFYLFCPKASKKWGILGPEFEEILAAKYDAIAPLSPSLFKAKQGQTWGLLDQSDKMIYDFKAKAFWKDSNRDQVLMEGENGFSQLSTQGEVLRALPFSHVLPASSQSYWWRYPKDSGKLMCLINGRRREETEDFYPFDDLTEHEGLWGIIDHSGNILITPQYAYIDFLEMSDNYKVLTGSLRFSQKEEYQTMLKGVKCGVIDPKGNYLIPATFEWIIEIAPNLWAVNQGGEVYFNDAYQEERWEVRGGKWGVVNQDNRLIVPIEYDNLFTNWYRVKDLLILQKGSETFEGSLPYDVYDFEGNQLDSQKVDYRDHIFYNS